MARHSRRLVTASTVLRILDEEGLLLTAEYQRGRRQLAVARRAAFTTPPTGPNQVWQLDHSENATLTGGPWRVRGVADYWSQGRVRLPLVAHGEPARRHRRGSSSPWPRRSGCSATCRWSRI